MVNYVYGLSFNEVDEQDIKNWKKVEKFYFGSNENLDFDTHFYNVTDLFGDASFAYGCHLAARYLSNY